MTVILLENNIRLLSVGFPSVVSKTVSIMHDFNFDVSYTLNAFNCNSGIDEIFSSCLKNFTKLFIFHPFK